MSIHFYYKVGQLKNGDKTTELSRQTRLALDFFCRNEGRIVTKDEFVKECWENRGVVVSDNTVRQTLFRIRSALSQAGAPEDTLVTQGRNGYLLRSGLIKVYYDDDMPLPDPDNVDDTDSPPVSDVPKRHYNARKVNKHSRLTRLCLFGFPVLALFLFGLSLRFYTLTSELRFLHYAEQGGRSFYFSDRITSDKHRALQKITYWLNENKISSEAGNQIYVGSEWRDRLTFFVCNGDIRNTENKCQTFNVIGENRS
ncbi:winged helix-turn-helix domain-containing protein [Cronobacter sakazakii]